MVDDYRCNKYKFLGGGVYFFVKSWRGCGCGYILMIVYNGVVF